MSTVSRRVRPAGLARSDAQAHPWHIGLRIQADRGRIIYGALGGGEVVEMVGWETTWEHFYSKLRSLRYCDDDEPGHVVRDTYQPTPHKTLACAAWDEASDSTQLG